MLNLHAIALANECIQHTHHTRTSNLINLVFVQEVRCVPGRGTLPQRRPGGPGPEQGTCPHRPRTDLTRTPVPLAWPKSATLKTINQG